MASSRPRSPLGVTAEVTQQLGRLTVTRLRGQRGGVGPVLPQWLDDGPGLQQLGGQLVGQEPRAGRGRRRCPRRARRRRARRPPQPPRRATRPAVAASVPLADRGRSGPGGAGRGEGLGSRKLGRCRRGARRSEGVLGWPAAHPERGRPGQLISGRVLENLGDGPGGATGVGALSLVSLIIVAATCSRSRDSVMTFQVVPGMAVTAPWSWRCRCWLRWCWCGRRSIILELQRTVPI